MSIVRAATNANWIVAALLLASLAGCAGGKPISFSQGPNVSPPENTTVSLQTHPMTAPGPVSPPGPSGSPIPLAPGLPGTPPSKVTGGGYFIDVAFIPSQEVYAPGQQVIIVAKITNGSSEPVTVILPLNANVVIPSGMDTGTIFHTFSIGSENRKMAVGEVVTYNLTWNQKDLNGNAAPAGSYFVDYRVTARAESTQREWTSGVRNTLFRIQSSQPPMVKTIDLNQSVNVTGLPLNIDANTANVSLVLTLKQVQMTEKGVTFFVVATSPDKPVSGYPGMEQAVFPAFAQYIVDGTIKSATISDTISTPTGIELRWGYNENHHLDPVPFGTKELTFRITSLGNWNGPWEFKIPLQ